MFLRRCRRYIVLTSNQKPKQGHNRVHRIGMSAREARKNEILRGLEMLL